MIMLSLILMKNVVFVIVGLLIVVSFILGHVYGEGVVGDAVKLGIVKTLTCYTCDNDGHVYYKYKNDKVVETVTPRCSAARGVLRWKECIDGHSFQYMRDDCDGLGCDYDTDSCVKANSTE